MVKSQVYQHWDSCLRRAARVTFDNRQRPPYIASKALNSKESNLGYIWVRIRLINGVGKAANKVAVSDSGEFQSEMVKVKVGIKKARKSPQTYSNKYVEPI